jgi:hypothetical protein
MISDRFVAFAYFSIRRWLATLDIDTLLCSVRSQSAF